MVMQESKGQLSHFPALGDVSKDIFAQKHLRLLRSTYIIPEGRKIGNILPFFFPKISRKILEFDLQIIL